MTCINSVTNGQGKPTKTFKPTTNDKAIQARARQKIFAFIRNRMESSELVKTETIMTYARSNDITPKQAGFALQQLKELNAIKWSKKTAWTPSNF